MSIVQIDKVYKYYADSPDGSFALFDVSVDFRKGSFNVILGESGSGKTTLLKLLSGIIRPSKGNIYFQGDNLNTLNSFQLAELKRKHFGFVIQEAGLLEHLKCFENIQFPDLDFNINRVDQLADYFEIAHCMNKFPNQISLGEKQRVTLARALYKNPNLIVADEPTANLDWRNAKKSLQLLKQYSKEGKTVFLATHDERILEFATDILILEKGMIIRKN